MGRLKKSDYTTFTWNTLCILLVDRSVDNNVAGEIKTSSNTCKHFSRGNVVSIDNSATKIAAFDQLFPRLVGLKLLTS